MLMSGKELDDVATKIYNVLAEEEISVHYIGEVLERARQIAMFETKVCKNKKTSNDDGNQGKSIENLTLHIKSGKEESIKKF